METIHWMQYHHTKWTFFIAASDIGLCVVGSFDDFDAFEQYCQKKFPEKQLKKDEMQLMTYTLQVNEFLNGKRKKFTIPLDLHGTSFQREVWEAALMIPYGETKSYGELAHMINNPKAVRAVGAALGSNPILFAIPCHRIIAKTGALTGFGAGLDMKEMLLTLEQNNK